MSDNKDGRTTGFLWISCNIGEKVLIGDDIVIVVLGIKSRKGNTEVKLGIDAPKSVPIFRTEILEGNS